MKQLAPFGTFSSSGLIVMCIAMAFLTGMELLGVFIPKFVTVTAIARSFIPRTVRGIICLWLFWHMVLYGWISSRSLPQIVKSLF